MRHSALLLSVCGLAFLAACETTGTPGPATAPTSASATDMPENAAPLKLAPMPSAPLDRSRTLTRIGFGSCLKQKDDMSIWPVIAGTEPDVFLFIGDNVYGDVWEDDFDLPDLKEAYATLASREEFAAFREQVPMMVTWDDHDYGRNDFGAGFPMRAESEELYKYVWDISGDDPRQDYPGIYYSEIIGEEEGRRVQILMLDTRYFRSDLMPTDEKNAPGKERYMPDPDPSKTMLGDAQWAWLAGELEKPADLRILVSSIQVIADGHGWEAWRTLPTERQKLYDTISAAGAESLVMISGDRHAGALYLKEGELSYPLWELTSSSLNAPQSKWRAEAGITTEEAGPYRVGGMYYDTNFGLIDIDWDADTLAFVLKGETGETVRKQIIPMADLRPVY